MLMAQSHGPGSSEVTAANLLIQLQISSRSVKWQRCRKKLLCVFHG
jgi:hypothetical protein